MPTPKSPLQTCPILHSDIACYYPAETCPLHTIAPPPQPPPPPMPSGDDDRPDAYVKMKATVAGVAAGRYSPSQAARFIRSLIAVRKLGPEPIDEEAALAEVELRGVLMHGQPPRNPEEWALAERRFDETAIREFRRWEELIRLRRAGIQIQPYIEAAEDEWLENTDRLAREAAERDLDSTVLNEDDE